jgi:hypothetical protein
MEEKKITEMCMRPKAAPKFPALRSAVARGWQLRCTGLPELRIHARNPLELGYTLVGRDPFPVRIRPIWLQEEDDLFNERLLELQKVQIIQLVPPRGKRLALILPSRLHAFGYNPPYFSHPLSHSQYIYNAKDYYTGRFVTPLPTATGLRLAEAVLTTMGPECAIEGSDTTITYLPPPETALQAVKEVAYAIDGQPLPADILLGEPLFIDRSSNREVWY